MTPEEATARFSAAVGETHERVGALPGGVSGLATEIRAPDGSRRVLKWTTGEPSITRRRTSVVLTERLRTVAGWPVPSQVLADADGWLFVAQTFMDGTPVRRLTATMLEGFLPLHDARLGLATPDDPGDFADHLVETLVEGGDRYCLHEPLRRHDARTRRVVERAEEIGRSLRPADLPADDLIHWDLHYGNVLQASDQISAVVDNDHVKPGDAAFDLLTLAVCGLGIGCDPEVGKRLQAAGIEALDDVRRRAYGAHVLLRFLDWPIRGGRHHEVERWLPLANRLLD